MSGSLVCVGVGMTLGAHICPISRSHIEQADKVFILMSNGIVESWVAAMNPNSESLQQYYQEGKSRHITYQEMVTAITQEVETGKKVTAAFYGHPGVFACVAHKAINYLHQAGYSAHMEAGISAEDCLYADLTIDPGKTGCIHYEASQFMFFKRQIDTAAHLILWQVGIAGDQTLSKMSTDVEYKQLLVELLLEHYPADHEVILYEAKVLPIQQVRKEQVKLRDLAKANLKMETTLVIQPATKLVENTKLRALLNTLDKKRTTPKLTLI
ncbi:SAM-dependent methyltransferase [Colwellia sp. MEBiC06753]